MLKLGDGDSSSGSDDGPSDDNLPQAELKKNLPVDSDVQFKKNIKKKTTRKTIESPTKPRASSPKTVPEAAPKPPMKPVPIKKDTQDNLNSIIAPMNNTEAVHLIPIAVTKKPKPEMRDAVT